MVGWGLLRIQHLVLALASRIQYCAPQTKRLWGKHLTGVSVPFVFHPLLAAKPSPGVRELIWDGIYSGRLSPFQHISFLEVFSHG